jgi:hypothetical protein
MEPWMKLFLFDKGVRFSGNYPSLSSFLRWSADSTTTFGKWEVQSIEILSKNSFVRLGVDLSGSLS